MNGLVIKEEFIEKIIDGTKRWEIRGSRTKIRGRIGLIQSKSGMVFGTAELVDCIGPLTTNEFRSNATKIGLENNVTRLPYKGRTFAWVLKDIRKLSPPVAYQHKQGAVIWVKLDAKVKRKISE